MFNYQIIERTRIIRQLIGELDNSDNAAKNSPRELLKYGYIHPQIQAKYDHMMGKISPPKNDVELPFSVIARYSNWFVMHPDKVAGEQIITSSMFFPIKIQAEKDDIINIIDKTLFNKDDDEIDELEILELEAEAMLLLQTEGLGALGMTCENLTKDELKIQIQAAKNLQIAKRKLIYKGINPYSSSMPNELIKELASWDIVSQSPYSDSYYDTICKSWDHTPEGSLRVADHWNFISRGIKHCKTDIPIENNNEWVLAKWENGVYKVLKLFKKISFNDEDKKNEYHKQLKLRNEQFLAQRNKNIIEQKQKQTIRNIQISDEIIAYNKLKNGIDIILKYIKRFQIDFKTPLSTNYYQNKLKDVFYLQLGFKKQPNRDEARKMFIKNKPLIKLIKGVYRGSGRHIKRVGQYEIIGYAQDYFKHGSITVNGETSTDFEFIGKKKPYIETSYSQLILKKIDKNELIYDLCFK